LEGKAPKSVFENIPYYQGKMDLWYSFACVGIDLLNDKGHLCFIATNKWITNNGAGILRNKVIADSQIKQLVDFGSYMIFESANIQTMIMLFEKNNRNDGYNFDYRKLIGNDVKLQDVIEILNKTSIKALYLKPTIIRDKLKDKFLTFSENDNIFEKIAKDATYLTKDELANGIHPHYDFVDKKHALLHDLKIGEGIFGLSEQERNDLELTANELTLIKPYYTTEQIHRYYSHIHNKFWLIYTDSSFKNPKSMNNYLHLKTHLDRFKNVITSDNKPYGLHRAREERFFKGEKIAALRKSAGKPSFSYSDFDCYLSASFYIIKTEKCNLKYLLGLLNSKLVAFWLKNKGKMQGDNYQLDKEPLMQVPIKISKNPQPIITLVEQILQSKQQNADTTALEKEIDTLVYELYGLTEDEIKLIEKI
jgi:adenine-specific DNA-methyltransferase